MICSKCGIMYHPPPHRTPLAYHNGHGKRPRNGWLISKRASIEREIAELERDIRRHRSEMMQIDATVLLFAPTLTRAKRDITRFQRSAHFMVGELT